MQGPCIGRCYMEKMEKEREEKEKKEKDEEKKKKEEEEKKRRRSKRMTPRRTRRLNQRKLNQKNQKIRAKVSCDTSNRSCDVLIMKCRQHTHSSFSDLGVPNELMKAKTTRDGELCGAFFITQHSCLDLYL